MREEGERRGRGNALFPHCRNCDSLTVVVVVAHTDRSSGWPPVGELTTVFVVCSFGLSQTFSKINFSLIPEVSRSLFVDGSHLESLVNVNTAFWILWSESKAVRSRTKNFSPDRC